MPTTFNPVFKNQLIDSLTGRAATIQLYYIQPWNGAQPADPATAPTGSSPFTAYNTSVIIGTFMSAPGMGVSQLAAPKSAIASSTVGSLTFARIYNTSGVGMIDTPVSLAGGGGGVILNTLNASSGVGLAVDKFSFKMPQSNGTIQLNADVVNGLASAFCVTPFNVALGTSASINVYSGAAPANADMAATGTLLVSFTTGTTSPWNVAAGGAAGLTANLTAAAVATGTAGYVRIVKNALALQGSVGTSAADFILDTVSIVSGATITLSEATISI